MTNTTGTTGTTSLTGNYNLDPAHSRLGFSARHAMVTKVRGAFNEVTGSGYLDEEDPSALPCRGHHQGGQHRHP